MTRLNNKVTICGLDRKADITVPVIQIWDDYDKRSATLASVKHGSKVTLVQRKGEGVEIETKMGTCGWVSAHFIKELK